MTGGGRLNGGGGGVGAAGGGLISGGKLLSIGETLLQTCFVGKRLLGAGCDLECRSKTVWKAPHFAIVQI
jgi:hypothetical protein